MLVHDRTFREENGKSKKSFNHFAWNFLCYCNRIISRDIFSQPLCSIPGLYTHRNRYNRSALEYSHSTQTFFNPTRPYGYCNSSSTPGILRLSRGYSPRRWKQGEALGFTDCFKPTCFSPSRRYNLAHEWPIYRAVYQPYQRRSQQTGDHSPGNWPKGHVDWSGTDLDHWGQPVGLFLGV